MDFGVIWILTKLSDATFMGCQIPDVVIYEVNYYHIHYYSILIVILGVSS